MTKTLEQIQKENRKFILEAIHGCSYDEALKKRAGILLQSNRQEASIFWRIFSRGDDFNLWRWS